MVLHPTLDPTTSSALEECLALQVVVGEAVGEEVEVVDSHLVGLLSSICHQILVRPCILGQDSIRCCLRGEWEALEEEDHPTLGLTCPHSSTDRVGTHSIALRYLVVEAPEDHYLPWEEEWVLG